MSIDHTNVTLGVSSSAPSSFSMLMTWPDWRPDYRVWTTLVATIVHLRKSAVARARLAKHHPAHHAPSLM